MLYFDWLDQLTGWVRRTWDSLVRPLGLAAGGWLLAVAGCEGRAPVTGPDPAIPEAAAAPAAAEARARDARDRRAAEPPRADPRGRPLGSFRFTMYYVAQEADYAPPRPAPAPERLHDDEDDELGDDGPTFAAIAGRPGVVSEPPDDVSGPPDKGVVLYERAGCTELARVGASFAAQLDLQGTGRLRDGRLVNTAGACACPRSPCYSEIEKMWAMGANGRLSPFRSVAVDSREIPLGTMLYLPELDGQRMPGKPPWGGFVHDGCVVADDRGGGIKGRALDFFVARKAYSGALYRRTRLTKVTVFDGAGWCEREDGRVRKAASPS